MFQSVLLAVVLHAGPPTDAQVLRRVEVPRVVGDAVVVKNKLADGLLVPVPKLGFVTLPVVVWGCDVYHTPPNFPAGAPPLWKYGSFFLLAE